MFASFMQTGSGSSSALIYEMDTKTYATEDCSGEPLFEESYRWQSINETSEPSYPCIFLICVL